MNPIKKIGVNIFTGFLLYSALKTSAMGAELPIDKVKTKENHQNTIVSIKNAHKLMKIAYECDFEDEDYYMAQRPYVRAIEEISDKFGINIANNAARVEAENGNIVFYTTYQKENSGNLEDYQTIDKIFGKNIERTYVNLHNNKKLKYVYENKIDKNVDSILMKVIQR